MGGRGGGWKRGRGIRIGITILNGRGMKLGSRKSDMTADFYRLGRR